MKLLNFALKVFLGPLIHSARVTYEPVPYTKTCMRARFGETNLRTCTHAVISPIVYIQFSSFLGNGSPKFRDESTRKIFT